MEQALNSGNSNILKPRKALNKAFLKVKPNRTQIEGFKENLIELLDRTNDKESEEFHKNLVIDFLKKTYYETNHFINTVNAEIVQLVYLLYGLTEEEIAVVEGA
ncbi:MAG: hypothetical protein R6W85_07260 [Gillisia sp.]